jgi:hypothetical protein
MPVTKTSVVSHTLISMNVSMTSGTIKCAFVRTLDGVASGEIPLVIEGVDMAVILGTPASPAKTVGNDITDLVYAYAISKGVIDGVIS